MIIMSQRIDYCANCLHHSRLSADETHCDWCLRFFYSEGRMPKPGDSLGITWAEQAVAISSNHFESLR